MFHNWDEWDPTWSKPDWAHKPTLEEYGRVFELKEGNVDKDVEFLTAIIIEMAALDRMKVSSPFTLWHRTRLSEIIKRLKRQNVNIKGSVSNFVRDTEDDSL